MAFSFHRGSSHITYVLPMSPNARHICVQSIHTGGAVGFLRIALQPESHDNSSGLKPTLKKHIRDLGVWEDSAGYSLRMASRRRVGR